MLTSPFQQPSPRQNLLAGQIHEAAGRGDADQLLLLQTQWVHRYGVETLPVDASKVVEIQSPVQEAGHPVAAVITEDRGVERMGVAAPGESIEEPVLSDQDQFHSPQRVDDVEQGEDSEQVDHQKQAEAASPFERFNSLLSESFDKRSEIEAKDAGRDSESDSAQKPASLAAVPVSAPPIRTPRSLRRWLPGGVDGLAEAS